MNKKIKAWQNFILTLIFTALMNEILNKIRRVCKSMGSIFFGGTGDLWKYEEM